ncbi:hypothetical protein V496_09281 [Pseudogymnoascus sp. VKM F-4515 (FW-2607)]|nr:hypothetical protein V496_09281 [Pseudogymnoascus sp. VKM F-4515 (FW-2607)]KFY97437.1 hypothetical protein V498_02068 [Pseudogymnoascus sp. VKM F-4517 (FW-2822)]
MKVTQLYIYPVKSLRGIALPSATVVGTGLENDRTFMLLRVEGGETTPRKLNNMSVSRVTEMALFKTALVQSSEGDGDSFEQFTVTYAGPSSSLPPTTITIPFVPDTENLEMIDVVMHKSPTQAYDMGAEYNSWFSAQFGYEVVLAYIGNMRRPVLGSLWPSAAQSAVTSATRSVSRYLSSYLPSSIVAKGEESRPPGITFADIAMFLIVTEESLAEASSRLPEGMEMDIRKFRPNIVLSGAEGAWYEDLWGQINIESKDGVEVELALTANCARCVSINIDYSTGKQALGEKGTVLKKLMPDRRVDKGNKYSPIFGRYGYLGKGAGSSISIGDDVSVVKRLEEPTTFDWKTK